MELAWHRRQRGAKEAGAGTTAATASCEERRPTYADTKIKIKIKCRGDCKKMINATMHCRCFQAKVD
jgi:hypothetical protein